MCIPAQSSLQVCELGHFSPKVYELGQKMAKVSRKMKIIDAESMQRALRLRVEDSALCTPSQCTPIKECTCKLKRCGWAYLHRRGLRRVQGRPQSPWNKIFGHKAFLRLSHKKKSAMRARGQSPCHLPLFHVKHRNCTKIPSPWEREWHNKMSNYSKKHIFARLELEIRKKHRYINDCAEWNTYINISITKFDRKKMKIAKKLHSGRHVIAKMNSWWF